MVTQQYDVVVIGGGSAGESAADYARRYGLRAVVVEQELVGGECSYWACMPSKALLRPTEALAAARRVPSVAGAVTGEVDVAAVLRSRDAFASHWDDKDQVEWLESMSIPLVRGHARLTGERRVEVTHDDGTTTALEARRAVVVATGTRAAVPPIPGLRDIRVWDSRAVTTAEQVPDRLLVLGGGVVGTEMAQAWRRLGAGEVTIVEALDRLLPNEEPFAGEELQAAFEAEGVDVRTGVKMVEVAREHDTAPVVASLEDGGRIEADELLVAVGRRANTDDLGLETVGLEPGGSLEVDGQLRVRGAEDWLLAVGDVNGRALLTHQGKYQARIAAAALGGQDVTAWADDKGAPRVVFTDPQVAAVGRTEHQARERGLNVRTARYDIGQVAGTVLRGRDISGTTQLVIDQDEDVIVGATFVGPDTGELLHAATVAVVGRVPMAALWHAVPAFPTMSEVWLRLLERDRARA